MEETKKYQYWMRSIHGIGNKKLKKLVEYCGGAKEAHCLTKRQLLMIPGIYEADAEAIEKSRDGFELDLAEEALGNGNISMITIEEEGFPERLRSLSDCPYALFYKGALPKEKERAAAVVGARMCTSYGRAAALEIAEKLARHGIGVVSGMAYGIDSFGHWGAIRGGGRTYAVLGCGVDICYPKGGQKLYEKIVETGGVISEYLPGTPPAPGRFPARNRLISAFSDVVAVVEAKHKSGSFITADYALEQGKEVYAVPGRISDACSGGCNELIRQGAGILASTDGLLQEFGIFPDESAPNGGKKKNLLEKEELMVYSCFDMQPKNSEELLQLTNLSAGELADVLVRLQAKGLIEEFYQNHYRKA